MTEDEHPRAELRRIMRAATAEGANLSDLAVYVAMWAHADGAGVSWPSDRALSEYVPLEESSIYRVRSRLEAAGLIEQEPRGAGRTNRYRLLEPANPAESRGLDDGNPAGARGFEEGQPRQTRPKPRAARDDTPRGRGGKPRASTGGAVPETPRGRGGKEVTSEGTSEVTTRRSDERRAHLVAITESESMNRVRGLDRGTDDHEEPPVHTEPTDDQLAEDAEDVESLRRQFPGAQLVEDVRCRECHQPAGLCSCPGGSR